MRDSYRKDRNKKPRIRITYILLIVVLTMTACFGLYLLSLNHENGLIDFNQLFSGTAAQTSSLQETVTEQTTAAATTPPEPVLVNPVPENAVAGPAYLTSCAFVGDSITTGLSGYGFVPNDRVLAAQGMNIDKINSATIKTASGEMKILDALTALNPQNIYIMLGSNGIAWLTNEKMIQEYSAFVDEVQANLPESTIYILSIPPVSAEKETDPDGAISNADIDTYNSALLSMADEKKLYFVDINTGLKGNDGKLPGNCAAGDGMHFQKGTYQIMLDYILHHTVKEPGL